MSFVTDAGLASYASIISGSNAVSWTQRLALPAIQAGANLLLLEWQKDQYDDIEDERKGYVQTAKSELISCYDELIALVKDASNKIPNAALYQPVSPDGERLKTVLQNFDSLKYSREFMEMMNRDHREMDLVRAIALNPHYYEMNTTTWCSLKSLINGELDINRVITILGDTTQTSLLNGRLGYDKRLAHRNLGLDSMVTKAQGREEVRRERVSQNNDVNPIGKQGNLMTMMLTPQQTLAMALQQAQLLQQSEQSANNLCSLADPYKAQELNMKFNKCIQRMQLTLAEGNMTNAYVPNYAQIFNSQIRDLSSGLASMFGGGGGVQQANGGGVAPTQDATKESGNVTGGFSQSYLKDAGFNDII